MSLPEGLKFPDDYAGKTTLTNADKVLISDTADNKKTKWILLSALQSWYESIFSAYSTKASIADADSHLIIDSADGNKIKRVLNSVMKTVFAPLSGALFSGKVSVGGSDMTPAASDRMTIGVLNTLPSNAVGAFIAWANSGVSQAGDIVIIPRSTLEGNVKIYAVNGTTPILIGTFTKNGLSISGSLTASNGLISNITAKNGTALPSDYPTGITTMEAGTSHSGWPVTYMEIITIKTGTDRVFQIASNVSSPYQVLIRNKTSGADTWNGWRIISGPSVQSTTSTSTFTHNCDIYGHGKITAQAASLTMAAPLGTAVDMQEFVMYLKDNGTQRSISWNAAFSGVMAALPANTTAGKQMVFFFVYNSTTSKWELMNTATGV